MMTKVPYPILKWRDAKEKEWAFRALHALGCRRHPHHPSTDVAWANLVHSPAFDGIGIDTVTRQDGTISECLIRFASTTPSRSRTLVNSGPHLISYIKRHGLAPKRDV